MEEKIFLILPFSRKFTLQEYQVYIQHSRAEVQTHLILQASFLPASQITLLKTLPAL